MKSKFISDSDIFEFESTYDLKEVADKPYHATTMQDIALHLAGPGYKKAVRCGGGCQVFATIKEANSWEKLF